MNKGISSFGLLCVSVSAILGSGWLFGSFFAAREAGPAAIISWIIGGAMICIIAFTFGEICSLVPVSGSSVIIPYYTYGNVVGIVFSLMIWFSYVTLMVIEVQAVLQYLSYFFPSIVSSNMALTRSGYCCAIILMLIIAFLNNYSLKWLINCNNFLTAIKVIAPVTVSLIVLYHFFGVSNIIHSAQSRFAPEGVHGIFEAIATGGVIFSFNAFKQAAELAGEVEKPSFAVPFAIVGSILVCLVIFLLLQVSFLVALKPSNIANGWESLTLSNNNSPFASLLTQSNLTWLLTILFTAAVFSPFGAGLMYGIGSARTLSAAAVNGFVPKYFSKLNSRGMPAFSVWTNFLVGIIIFIFFKGWNSIAALLTCLFAISYAAAPISMIAMRFQVPDAKRSLKLPFGFLWGYVAFYFCTLFIYWCGWDVISKVGFLILLCLIVLFAYKSLNKNVKLNWAASSWMWFYFIGLTFFSYIGNYGGGLSAKGEKTIMIFMAVYCALTAFLAVKFKTPPSVVREYIMDIQKTSFSSKK